MGYDKILKESSSKLLYEARMIKWIQLREDMFSTISKMRDKLERMKEKGAPKDAIDRAEKQLQSMEAGYHQHKNTPPSKPAEMPVSANLKTTSDADVAAHKAKIAANSGKASDKYDADRASAKYPEENKFTPTNPATPHEVPSVSDAGTSRKDYYKGKAEEHGLYDRSKGEMTTKGKWAAGGVAAGGLALAGLAAWRIKKSRCKKKCASLPDNAKSACMAKC